MVTYKTKQGKSNVECWAFQLIYSNIHGEDELRHISDTVKQNSHFVGVHVDGAGNSIFLFDDVVARNKVYTRLNEGRNFKPIAALILVPAYVDKKYVKQSKRLMKGKTK